MRGHSDNADVCANSVGATSRHETPGPDDRGKIVPEFAVVVRDVWSVKAPAAVHQYSRRSERTCRAWCSDVEAPASAAFALLRGDEGYRFLCRLMRDNPPAWWIECERFRDIGQKVERVVRDQS